MNFPRYNLSVHLHDGVILVFKDLTETAVDKVSEDLLLHDEATFIRIENQIIRRSEIKLLLVEESTRELTTI